MDTYADDLATLLETLDVKGATMNRPFDRRRRGGALLISAVPPHIAQTPT